VSLVRPSEQNLRVARRPHRAIARKVLPSEGLLEAPLMVVLYK